MHGLRGQEREVRAGHGALMMGAIDRSGRGAIRLTETAKVEANSRRVVRNVGEAEFSCYFLIVYQ